VLQVSIDSDFVPVLADDRSEMMYRVMISKKDYFPHPGTASHITVPPGIACREEIADCRKVSWRYPGVILVLRLDDLLALQPHASAWGSQWNSHKPQADAWGFRRVSLSGLETNCQPPSRTTSSFALNS
jgi:hypothetical protein